jgi:hypothetical protein
MLVHGRHLGGVVFDEVEVSRRLKDGDELGFGGLLGRSRREFDTCGEREGVAVDVDDVVALGA